MFLSQRSPVQPTQHITQTKPLTTVTQTPRYRFMRHALRHATVKWNIFYGINPSAKASQLPVPSRQDEYPVQKLVRTTEVQALVTQISWHPVGSSVWMALLASFAPNKIWQDSNHCIEEGTSIISRPGVLLSTGTSRPATSSSKAHLQHGVRAPAPCSCHRLSGNSPPRVLNGYCCCVLFQPDAVPDATSNFFKFHT